ncbi:uncharacterized protein LOC115626851 [Scaptodrosophila lebanonensis]|uniref:Uncharacterized protein LOC115626851 n=1 Tax=Drosophila lebanonensis TaxID=7225 RepID=A0A6J2TRR7_DROLE|nr:uncharacterized protein LOC115626851 [Scaptodrosophila lebanonensis]XP_030378210.1 uncharacterized protein LOC115626851 [Scaptodrosophila lebanonensis]XP_030378211.1 uncharacterized protein LOC115626851 [Scaptodrosophila lebanonensis]
MADPEKFEEMSGLLTPTTTPTSTPTPTPEVVPPKEDEQARKNREQEEKDLDAEVEEALRAVDIVLGDKLYWGPRRPGESREVYEKRVKALLDLNLKLETILVRDRNKGKSMKDRVREAIIAEKRRLEMKCKESPDTKTELKSESQPEANAGPKPMAVSPEPEVAAVLLPKLENMEEEQQEQPEVQIKVEQSPENLSPHGQKRKIDVKIEEIALEQLKKEPENNMQLVPFKRPRHRSTSPSSISHYSGDLSRKFSRRYSPGGSLRSLTRRRSLSPQIYSRSPQCHFRRVSDSESPNRVSVKYRLGYRPCESVYQNQPPQPRGYQRYPRRQRFANNYQLVRPIPMMPRPMEPPVFFPPPRHPFCPYPGYPSMQQDLALEVMNAGFIGFPPTWMPAMSPQQLVAPLHLMQAMPPCPLSPGVTQEVAPDSEDEYEADIEKVRKLRKEARCKELINQLNAEKARYAANQERIARLIASGKLPADVLKEPKADRQSEQPAQSQPSAQPLESTLESQQPKQPQQPKQSQLSQSRSESAERAEKFIEKMRAKEVQKHGEAATNGGGVFRSRSQSCEKSNSHDHFKSRHAHHGYSRDHAHGNLQYNHGRGNGPHGHNHGQGGQFGNSPGQRGRNYRSRSPAFRRLDSQRDYSNNNQMENRRFNRNYRFDFNNNGYNNRFNNNNNNSNTGYNNGFSNQYNNNNNNRFNEDNRNYNRNYNRFSNNNRAQHYENPNRNGQYFENRINNAPYNNNHRNNNNNPSRFAYKQREEISHRNWYRDDEGNYVIRNQQKGERKNR